jgi:uncharacterized SAM-binding protein YcdF (DUF218 family)
MYGLTRATTTLIAAAGAGLLIWFATQIDDKTLGGFWAVYGLIAGAGLLMALSQLLGGWTKWGWPRLSATFLLTAFVPIAIVSLWIILAAEPGNGWFHRHVLSWSSDLHIQGLVNDLKEYIPVFAFGIGLVFGYSFDTTGPRTAVVAPATTTGRRGFLGRRRTADVDGDGIPDADEPVTRDRTTADDDVPVEDRDRVTTS